MVVLDAAIVNVALPSIKTALHFSQADLQWIVNAYTLTFGGFLMLGGRAADLLGRRRVFMFGLAVFSIASLACGLATSEAWLIIARGVRGSAPRSSRPRPCRSSPRRSPRAMSATKPSASGGAGGRRGAAGVLLGE